MDKQQIWDLITDESFRGGWEEDEKDDYLEMYGRHRDLFFSDRLQFDTKDRDVLAKMPVFQLLDELQERPQLTVEIGRWWVTLSSPVANDIHLQDHHPTWADNFAVESCHRGEANGIHSATWCLG